MCHLAIFFVLLAAVANPLVSTFFQWIAFGEDASRFIKICILRMTFTKIKEMFTWVNEILIRAH